MKATFSKFLLFISEFLRKIANGISASSDERVFYSNRSSNISDNDANLIGNLVREVSDLNKSVLNYLSEPLISNRQPEFDVFIAYNLNDYATVDIISSKLKSKGIKIWLRKEQVPPGRWIQEIIQEAIPKVKTAAILIGSQGLDRGQVLELHTFITQCINESIPVIPVLLPGIKSIPSNFLFLSEFEPVAIENINDDGWLGNLIWGITGVKV